MEITKKRADKCRSHHTACDCREYRYQEMEIALKVIHTWASVPGCLADDQVVDLCNRALGRGGKDDRLELHK